MRSTFGQFVRIFEDSPLLAISGIFTIIIASVFSAVGGVPHIGEFVPHRYCMVDSMLIAIHAVSDLIIGLAYMVISTVLFSVSRKTKLAKWLLISFGVFIVACGLTHFMEDITLYIAIYRVSAAVKVFCALASIATASVVFTKRKEIKDFFENTTP